MHQTVIRQITQSAKHGIYHACSGQLLCIPVIYYFQDVFRATMVFEESVNVLLRPKDCQNAILQLAFERW